MQSDLRIIACWQLKNALELVNIFRKAWPFEWFVEYQYKSLPKWEFQRLFFLFPISTHFLKDFSRNILCGPILIKHWPCNQNLLWFEPSRAVMVCPMNVCLILYHITLLWIILRESFCTAFWISFILNLNSLSSILFTEYCNFAIVKTLHMPPVSFYPL